MSDHRDRTLVLRVLVPSLEVRLRDKMKDAEDLGASRTQSNRNTPVHSIDPTTTAVKEALIDLEGVTCEPAIDGSTLWNFRCDGASYPARLVNLPCPVELHKTHDHCMYYKCVDVAQMLVVYEDQMALEEAEAAANYKSDEFPSYYPHGITPPLKRVVERRFMKREHGGTAPPRAEVATVEHELQQLMERIANKKPPKTGRAAANRQPAQPTSSTKVIEEIFEEVVDHEPWMDDYGKQSQGIEIDDQDNICTKHPELFLDPEEIAKITLTDQPTLKKKKKKKKPVEGQQRSTTNVKKGIASKKSTDEVDEITQIATLMSQNVDQEDFGEDFGEGFFNFEGDDPLAEFGIS